MNQETAEPNELYIHFEPETGTTEQNHGPFIGFKIDENVLWTATGGNAPDEEFADYDWAERMWHLRSAPDVTFEGFSISDSTGSKDSSQVYVFFETDQAATHTEVRSETYGPFVETMISDEALTVDAAGEDTSLELAKFERGAGWWRRRHIEKHYPQVPEIIGRYAGHLSDAGDTGWYRLFIVSGPLGTLPDQK